MSSHLIDGGSSQEEGTKTFKCQLREPMRALRLPSHLVPRETPGSGPRSLQAVVPPLPAPLLLHQRHAGAAHRDGDVNLGVGVASSDAGARSLQDDRRSVDRSAAVLLALLAGASEQTALTQAVGFRDVAGEPGRVVRKPGRNSTRSQIL